MSVLWLLRCLFVRANYNNLIVFLTKIFSLIFLYFVSVISFRKKTISVFAFLSLSGTGLSAWALVLKFPESQVTHFHFLSLTCALILGTEWNTDWDLFLFLCFAYSRVSSQQTLTDKKGMSVKLSFYYRYSIAQPLMDSWIILLAKHCLSSEPKIYIKNNKWEKSPNQ